MFKESEFITKADLEKTIKEVNSTFAKIQDRLEVIEKEIKELKEKS